MAKEAMAKVNQHMAQHQVDTCLLRIKIRNTVGHLWDMHQLNKLCLNSSNPSALLLPHLCTLRPQASSMRLRLPSHSTMLPRFTSPATTPCNLICNLNNNTSFQTRTRHPKEPVTQLLTAPVSPRIKRNSMPRSRANWGPVVPCRRYLRTRPQAQASILTRPCFQPCAPCPPSQGPYILMV